ncbi:RlpA-like double-psi beta-barrel-protein domain-containing protein-containing protein [Mycotypha africana]|uniref:RlpA-like double-psi beta-barrel-protein domain-containing protein-containing protein n=1 Tax=Mycotypha africana TaxID=64632 RepID=UPI002301A6D4|nr:RlpA-like double-psi beta-barrel-protein domain-containing protein-containing protein [Mycotypha africana]KAI8984691.1 RlpA-like double-psi beta-barrel-protein domain-containing protein-containing protein [Mycotypha africana]
MQAQFLATLFATIAVLAAFVAAAPATEKRHKSYKGTATWFKPKHEGGSHAACGGKHIDNHSRIVALNAKQYGDEDEESEWCGKEIKIHGKHGSVTATILDVCPECDKGDLDLTPVLFKEVVGDMDIGEGDIEWELI